MQQLIVQAPQSALVPWRTQTPEGNVVMCVILARGVEIKEAIMKTTQIILTYANLKDSLAATLQMLKEELKNKPDELVVQFDLCNDMVIWQGWQRF